MIVYKIVKHMYAKRWSLTGDSWNDYELESGIVLEYSTEFVTVPKILNSKLFAFDTEANAREYAGTGSDKDYIEIWKAETPDTETPKYKSQFFIADNIFQFWRNDAGFVDEVPHGTVFCPTLQLVEKVA